MKFRHFEETASYLFILFQLQYDSKNIVQNLESCLLMMEQQKTVKNNKTTNNEVVLRISNNQEIRDFGATQVAETSSHSKGSHAEELIELENVRSSFLGRSEFSKPKARMVEPPLPKDASFVAEKTQIKNSNSPNKKVLPRDVPDGIGTVITPRTPLIGTPREGEEVDDDDDEEEVYKTAEIEVSKRSGKKMKLMSWIELFAFVSILGFLIASLMVHNLQHKKIWSLELWKWCVLTLVIISGRLVTSWFINVLVFLIERNFLFKKKVLYFVYGVRMSVQAFIWLSLVLLAWSLVFHHGVKRTRKVTRILGYITRALASFVISAAIWLAKTLLIKLLSSHFQSTRFFDRVQESIFHQYILRTLSGPPLMEMAEMVGKSSSSGRLSFKTLVRDNEKKGTKEQVIDVEKLKKMKQKKVSAWTMKGLVDVIKSSGLSTISYTPESIYEEESDQKDNEITSEWEAKAAAYRIFRNVAKPGSK